MKKQTFNLNRIYNNHYIYTTTDYIEPTNQEAITYTFTEPLEISFKHYDMIIDIKRKVKEIVLMEDINCYNIYCIYEDNSSGDTYSITDIGLLNITVYDPPEPQKNKEYENLLWLSENIRDKTDYNELKNTYELFKNKQNKSYNGGNT